MPDYFNTTLRRLNNLVDEDLNFEIIQSPRSTRGDVQTVAELEELNEGMTDRFDTTQTTIQAIDADGAVYAEVIIHTLDKDPNVALLDWVEVVDANLRGNGIGRILHEEAVEYIEDELNATTIYTKVENPKMQSVNIDTGFQQIDAPNKDAWYRRD